MPDTDTPEAPATPTGAPDTDKETSVGNESSGSEDKASETPSTTEAGTSTSSTDASTDVAQHDEAKQAEIETHLAHGLDEDGNSEEGKVEGDGKVTEADINV